MKSQRLLMVTSTFPYDHGETFVKAELEHIAKYFGEVQVVPCFYTTGIKPRYVKQDVNLGYASKRWGLLRKFHVITSFVRALQKYEWIGDLAHILRQDHKVENLKELVRALYRAQLFENFLTDQLIKDKQKFDLIYFYWMLPEIMGAIGFRKSANVAIKIVARAHRGDLYENLKIGNYIGLRRSIVAGIDEIYCISDDGKSYLQEKYPSSARKFHTARLGVDDPGYLSIPPSDDELSIVSCSFVVYEKRLHLIVEAIEYLLDRDPLLKIKWTHIGNGKLYDQLRAYVLKKLDNRARVVFAGYLTQDQVMELYRNESFDVIVNVSDSEGIPVSLMEASSAGIPMVATDVGGNREIVNAGNGVLIAADADISTIASALIQFRDRALTSRYREGARSYWKQRYHAQTNYNEFGQDLIRILESPAHAV